MPTDNIVAASFSLRCFRRLKPAPTAKLLIIVSILLLLGTGQAQAKSPPPGMVLIPAGQFMMGDKDGDEDELPQIKVYLDAFYLDKNEVTNAQYNEFVKATAYRKQFWWNDSKFNQPDQPVVGIYWENANAYAQWAGKRLPTEAEWEKAAKGNKGARFPWGNAWDKKLANSSLSDPDKPTAVGSYPGGANSYGVNDMAGNVWEWCSSWYHSHYYYRCPLKNPPGPKKGEAKVIRGGAWIDLPQQLRTSNRYYSHPNVRSPSIGFRCAKDVE